LTPILLTGGAGYIGSHTALLLDERGYDVTVVDDLSRGHRHNVEPGRLREATLLDTDAIAAILREKPYAAVIHFAAYIAVGESAKNPALYFQNNVSGSLSLLTAMVRAGVSRLVFSSTAALYGIPGRGPITEDFPIAPISPYGDSKAMVERFLHWFDAAHGLRSICLRYFNACGADPAGRRGEEHDPETHLIPLLLRAVRTGEPATVFGDDYPTPDGTCIRDYIHVTDLAAAHIAAVERLIAGASSDAFNVGAGRGHSVREVIGAVERITGRRVPYTVGPRRHGDPPSLVADSAKLEHTLGWAPRHSSLDEIVATAWSFERARHGIQ
jgi:UDP-glucose-4-epimerase GalE